MHIVDANAPKYSMGLHYVWQLKKTSGISATLVPKFLGFSCTKLLVVFVCLSIAGFTLLLSQLTDIEDLTKDKFLGRSVISSSIFPSRGSARF